MLLAAKASKRTPDAAPLLPPASSELRRHESAIEVRWKRLFSALRESQTDRAGLTLSVRGERYRRSACLRAADYATAVSPTSLRTFQDCIVTAPASIRSSLGRRRVELSPRSSFGGYRIAMFDTDVVVMDQPSLLASGTGAARRGAISRESAEARCPYCAPSPLGHTIGN